jgi:ribonuclease D
MVNLYDLQIAAYLLGYGKLSLKDFIMAVLHKDGDEFLDCQTSDWNTRPLTGNQLEYAAGDVKYLILLKKKIAEEVKFKRIGSLIKLRSKKLENVRFNSEIEPYMKIKNYHSLNKRQKKIFQAFFYIRDSIAKERNLPPYKIIPNDQLIALSKRPPENLEMWIKKFPDKTIWELEQFDNAYKELRR